MTRPMAERPASSLRSFSSSEPGVVTSTSAAIELGPLSKTALPTRRVPSGSGAVFPSLLKREGLRLVGGNFLGFLQDAGGGHLVAVFEIHQPDALGGAARLANGGRLDADHLAVLADNHHIRIFLHQQYAHHAAGLVGGLHVDDALAAARGEAVGIERGALAVTVLRDGEEQSLFLDNFHADQVIVLVEAHGAHAARLAAHGAHVLFAEADRLTFVRAQEDARDSMVACKSAGAS